jgi:ketosteroid isomerase-like protein
MESSNNHARPGNTPAVSKSTLRLAHNVIDAVERRDETALLELTDPEVRWHSAFAIGGFYEGHAGMRRYVRDMVDAWDVVRLDIDRELDVGDVVVFVGRIQYRGKGSGVAGETESGYVLKFRGERVTLFRPFPEPATALASLGQEEYG